MADKTLKDYIIELTRLVPSASWNDGVYEARKTYLTGVDNDDQKDWYIRGAVTATSGGLTFLNGYGDKAKNMMTVSVKMINDTASLELSTTDDHFSALTDDDLLSLKGFIIEQIGVVTVKIQTAKDIKASNLNRLATI